MTSIQYDEIFSRFYTKVEAFDFLYETMTSEMMAEHLLIWLHSAISYPYIRKLFKSIEIDDENMILTYELNYSIDEYSDQEFIIEILACGIVYNWIEPKVKSITNIYQNFTSSEQKFYSQSNHLSELRELCSDADARIRSLIRDRGFFNNLYLDGKSASAYIRGAV